MTSPTVFLFDIGNVLFYWNENRLLDTIFNCAPVPDTQENRDLFRAWNAGWDRGSLQELSQQQIKDYPAFAEMIRDYWDKWPVSLDGVLEGTVDILRELKALGHRAYTASNFAWDTFAIARAQMPFFDLFDGEQLSGRISVTKPSPKFFQIMMERFSFTPETAVFIDDRAENIAAAEALGIHGVLFENPAQLRNALSRMGVGLTP